MLNCSGAKVSASSAVSTLAWASPSSASIRRCSTNARAIGLENGRSGRRNSNAVLWPSLPASSRAVKIIATSVPAQGCSVKSLGALSDPVLGARLRQHQREVGRVVERSRRVAVGSLAVEQLEHRLRADDAVIVLELVGELQRSARLAFRLLGERDGRRLVRDGGELPGDVARGGAA